MLKQRLDLTYNALPQVEKLFDVSYSHPFQTAHAYNQDRTHDPNGTVIIVTFDLAITRESRERHELCIMNQTVYMGVAIQLL